MPPCKYLLQKRQPVFNSFIVKTEMFHNTAKLFEDFLVPPANVTVELN